MLRFAPQMAYQVYDLFPHSAIIKEEDGSFTVRTYAPDAEWLYSMLLQYGANVRVLSPPQVRERLLRRVREIVSLYEPGHI